MATAEEDSGHACGYIEDIGSPTATTASVHKPKKASEMPITAAMQGVIANRRYCVLRDGHSGGHSFRTT